MSRAKKKFTSAKLEQDTVDGRPALVRVFGKSFDIHYCGPSPLGDGAHGMCMYNHQTIFVLDGQKPAEEADTVLHELIHAIDFTMGLDLTERQVTQLATGIYGMLQDNPEFAQWLIEERP